MPPRRAIPPCISSSTRKRLLLRKFTLTGETIIPHTRLVLPYQYLHRVEHYSMFMSRRNILECTENRIHHLKFGEERGDDSAMQRTIFHADALLGVDTVTFTVLFGEDDRERDIQMLLVRS